MLLWIMQGMITLRDALEVISATDADGNFIPFSGTRITCNLREGTGGKRETYETVVLAGAPFGKKNTTKNANHFMNGTRNVMVPGKTRPITVHNVLWEFINGERVII